MDSTGGGFAISEGAEVFDADGVKLGGVSEVRPDLVVVKHGTFFPTRYYVPRSAVSNVDGGTVNLAVTKEAVLQQGWDIDPVGTAADDATTEPAAPRAARTVADGESITVPVRQEELTATTTERQLGEVRIETGVLAEEQTLSVPVTHEQVRVSRRPVDRPVVAADTTFQHEVIDVPVFGEEVEVHTTARVVGEVEIGKETVERIEEVSGTVRHEEIRIIDDVEGGVTGATGDGSAVIDPRVDGS